MGTFPDDWSGKFRFALVVAVELRKICAVTPGLYEESFVEDVKYGARLWIEAGEPIKPIVEPKGVN